MASEKQISKWSKEAEKLSKNPDYVQLYIQYRQEAKKADQRLVRLEKLAEEEHFKGVLEYAYKRAVRDVKSWGGDKRFNTAPPTTVTELRAKLTDIQDFLYNKPTSTKSGIVSMYKKRAETMTKRYGAQYGVDFSWQDIANFFERKGNEKADIKKASKTLIRAIALIKKSAIEEDLQEIKDEAERIEHIEASGVVKARAKKLLKNGLTYDELMGGN